MLSLTTILNKIDKAICSYIGIQNETTSPQKVKLIKDKIFITNTVSYKRHYIEETWDDFKKIGLKQITPTNNQKLCSAMGKVIAKKLVLSFEEIKIKRNNYHPNEL